MSHLSTFRRFGLAALSLFAVMALAPTTASARSHVSIGIGVGFPVYPGIGYGHAGYYGNGFYGHRHFRPPHRAYYRPYFRPYFPPVVLAPPIIYAPPPVYAVPVYQQPVQAVPTSDIYRANNGQYCREFQSTANINGSVQATYGTACQDAGGTWRIVN